MPQSDKRLTALVVRAAEDMPPDAAAAWAHLPALLTHAATHGAVSPAAAGVVSVSDARAEFDRLVSSHPALKYLGGQVAEILDDRPIPDALWDELTGIPRRVADDPHRVDGHRLGDHYQELNAHARKTRALCQTPPWVAQLLLELGYSPAVREWGWDAATVMDPAAGTGHILVEAAIAAAVTRRVPALDDGDRAAVLDKIHGVELDPYAAFLAAYRLLLLAARMDGGALAFRQLSQDVRVNVASEDSLLTDPSDEPLLRRGRYACVIMNPPYITPPTAAYNQLVRRTYPKAVTYRQYSLGLPFTYLATELVWPGGWVAQITTNAWMKREYGRLFVEEYLSVLDVRWIIDTSGAYIPGHGTPTVILVHRNQAPDGDRIHSILGARGEQHVPDDPRFGRVWVSILQGVYEILAAERLRVNLAAQACEPHAYSIGREG